MNDGKLSSDPRRDLAIALYRSQEQAKGRASVTWVRDTIRKKLGLSAPSSLLSEWLAPFVAASEKRLGKRAQTARLKQFSRETDRERTVSGPSRTVGSHEMDRERADSDRDGPLRAGDKELVCSGSSISQSRSSRSDVTLPGIDVSPKAARRRAESAAPKPGHLILDAVAALVAPHLDHITLAEWRRRSAHAAHDMAAAGTTPEQAAAGWQADFARTGRALTVLAFLPDRMARIAAGAAGGSRAAPSTARPERPWERSPDDPGSAMAYLRRQEVADAEKRRLRELELAADRAEWRRQQEALG